MNLVLAEGPCTQAFCFGTSRKRSNECAEFMANTVTVRFGKQCSCLKERAGEWCKQVQVCCGSYCSQ